MEFALCGDCGLNADELLSVQLFLLILSTPIAFYGLFFYRWNQPCFEFGHFTRIEFPLPHIPPPAHYEPTPVAMMVGSCSEAKRCAYCHEEFDCDSARRFCFACKSATHKECAILNGSCSVFGCNGATQLRSVESIPLLGAND